MKAQSDVYHYMNPYKTIPNFQKLLNGHHLHYLQFRVIKIKTAEENRKRNRKSGNKYRYNVDISTALKLARKYFIENEARAHASTS